MGWGGGLTPPTPLGSPPQFFSGSSANQKFSLAPTAKVSLGQKNSSAPLTTQGLLRGGGVPPTAPPTPPPLDPPKNSGNAPALQVLVLSPCEKKMVCCSNNETFLILYDLITGNELLYFDGHSDQIMSACFSPEGKYLISASRDETVIQWDTSTAKQVQCPERHNAH